MGRKTKSIVCIIQEKETDRLVERMVNARERPFHRITETNWDYAEPARIVLGTELPAGIYLAIQRNFLMQA